MGAVRYYESTSAASTAPLRAEDGREDETSAVDDGEQVQDEEHVDNSSEVDTISVAAPGKDADAHRYCKGLLHYLKSGKATERFKDLRKNEAEFDIGARRYVVQNLRSVLEHVARKEVEGLARQGQGLPSIRNKMDETDPGTLFAATQQPHPSSSSGSGSGAMIGLHSEDLANYPYLLRQMQITDAGTLEPLLDLVVNRILQKRFRLVYAWKRPGGEADDHDAVGEEKLKGQNPFKKSASGATTSTSTLRKEKASSTSTSSSSKPSTTFDVGEHQDARLPKVPLDFRKTAKVPSQLSTFVKTLKELPVDFKGPLHAVRRFADKVVEHLERFDTATLCFLLDEMHSRGVPLDVVHHRARFYRELCSRLVEAGGKGRGATDQQHVRAPLSVPSTQERQILLEKLTPVVFEHHGSAKFALLSEDPHSFGGKNAEHADAAVEVEEPGATEESAAAEDKTATTGVLENGTNAQEKEQEGKMSQKALSRAADAKAVQQASEDLQALKLFLGTQLRLQIAEAKDVRELEVRCGALLRYFLDQSFESCTGTEEGFPDASNVQKQASPHGAARPSTSANKATAPTTTGQDLYETIHPKQAILRDFCARARGLVKAQKEYGKLLWHTRGLEHWARAEIVREWFLPMVDAVKSGRNAMDLFLLAKWLEMMSDLEETDLPEVGELRELLTKRILARKTGIFGNEMFVIFR